MSRSVSAASLEDRVIGLSVSVRILYLEEYSVSSRILRWQSMAVLLLGSVAAVGAALGRRGMERIDIGGTSIEMLVAGSGPPLVFLHGIDYFAQHKLFLDALTQKFHVIAPRHPGFGNSPRPAWMRSVGDLAYLYLDLLDRLALDEVLLVGSSFGGWLAQEIAVRSTARLGRLVLIDSLGVK